MEPIITKLRKIERKIFENIRFKLSVFIFVLLIITTLVFYILTVRMMDQYILNELIKRAESLSRSVAASAVHGILLGDVLGIDNIIAKLEDLNKDVEYVAVVDSDMNVIAHTDPNKSGEKIEPVKGRTLKKRRDGLVINEVSSGSGDYFEISAPISFKDKKFGTILLGVNKSVLLDVNRRARARILVGFSVALVLGAVGIIILSYFLTRPLQELSVGVNDLKEGKRSRPLRVYSKDELGKLTESFNEMAELITQQKQSLNEYARELEDAYISTVKVLAAAIDARDPYTLGHSARVARLSLMLGKAIGLNGKELEDLEIACLFHDVGKLNTPDFILQKVGKLTSTEYREIMSHPETGADILSKAPSLHKYIPSIRHHHEWYNGNGYPKGLKGEEIPLFSAIISIADAFDAMTSKRPYRNPLSKTDAIKEVGNFSGKQFNPYLVETFMQVMSRQEWPVEELYKPGII
ncbi:MAG: HD domain-containing phosphohydrolase [Nitrospirota bacterium]